MKYPKTVAEMLAMTDVPVVAIDQESMFTYINVAFTNEFGWTEDDLLDKPVTEIMPKAMRSAHNVGFARYLTTETSVLLGKPLPLMVLYKDGTEKKSEHYILGEKKNGRWRFSAIVNYPDQNAE